VITVVNLHAMENNEDWIRVSKNKTYAVYKLKESSAQALEIPNPEQIRISQQKTNDHLKLMTILYGLYDKENR